MYAATSALAVLAATLAACSEAPREAATDNAAATDIEALPPDESVAAEPDNSDNADNAEY